MVMGQIQEAERTYEELLGALKCAGIVLPSLSIDIASIANRAPRPLIELGRCNRAP